jgi:hypothetical protein
MGALQDIEDAVRRIIVAWEDTGEYPSSCAQKIVARVLAHERLFDARTELRHVDGKIQRSIPDAHKRRDRDP